MVANHLQDLGYGYPLTRGDNGMKRLILLASLLAVSPVAAGDLPPADACAMLQRFDDANKFIFANKSTAIPVSSWLAVGPESFDVPLCLSYANYG